MEEPSLGTLLGTAAISGIISHQAIFKRFEVDTHPVIIFVAFAGAPYIVSCLLTKFYPDHAPSATSATVLFVGTFLTALLISILSYRAFFHPLRHFPGPFQARLSKIWALSQAAKSGLKWYQVDAKLHKKHGDYVRTGPRELSIVDPKAIPLILGFSSKTNKGPFYDSMEDSVSTTRDQAFHKQRRKVWDSSVKSLLTNYAPTLETFTDVLLTRINRDLGTPVTINELTLHYSYDVMTQLAYGKAGGFLSGSAGKTADSVIAGIQQGIDAIGLLNQVPWMLTLITTFAGLGGPMKAFNDWSNDALVRRRKEGSEYPDLMKFLLENTPDDAKGRSLLFSESRVIIGAGTDTTATALAEIFICLAHRPEYVQIIRAELDPVFVSRSFNCQVAYPSLESVVNEVLRLFPPVLFGSQRVTPPEGLTVSSTFIPGDMVVYMPTYQLHRDPRNFVQPTEFIPERWSSKPELVLNRSAWMPFLIGPNNCPGKSLAMMEIRSVLARVLTEYDVGFQEGTVFDWGFFDGVKDHFVAGVPKIKLVFTKRANC